MMFYVNGLVWNNSWFRRYLLLRRGKRCINNIFFYDVWYDGQIDSLRINSVCSLVSVLPEAILVLVISKKEERWNLRGEYIWGEIFLFGILDDTSKFI